MVSTSIAGLLESRAIYRASAYRRQRGEKMTSTKALANYIKAIRGTDSLVIRNILTILLFLSHL